MKMNMKRVFSLFLALFLVLGILPGIALSAFAEETTEFTDEETIVSEEEGLSNDSGIALLALGDSVAVDTLVNGLTATHNGVDNLYGDGIIPGTVSWGAEKDSASGAVTITGNLTGFNDGWAWEDTNTLTLTNSTGSEAVLTFDYEITCLTRDDYVQINGEEKTGTGACEFTLQDSESIEIFLSVAFWEDGGDNGASIKLKNVRLGVNVDVETTFLAAENGTYTVSYGDTVTAITEETKISNKATTNYTLTATAAEGYSFAGWYNQTKGVYIGAGSTSKNVRFEEACSIQPLFLKTENAVYAVGDARFVDLDSAVIYANNVSDKVVVLLKDSTLESGSYTIPAGVTLLIPFNDANTLYTDKPGCTSSKDNNVRWETPYVYRTLTMADGATLTVKGTVSVGSMHAAGGAQTAGSPTGAYGHIAMNSGSNITVENGGKLYAWGYITGSGTITANSGAEVYENLQVTDFRGGSASATLVPTGEDDPLLDKKKVFPFSQYYVQNIEVPLTLYAGAKECVYTTIYALDDVNSVMIDFIGTTSSMFYVGEGSYVVKDYDPATDRLNLTAGGTGSVQVNGLSLTMAGVTVSSSMFNLPITSNITININGGSATINQDAALLPGSQVNIAQGASLTVASGHNVFAYDATEWAMDNFVYNNVKIRPVSFSPSGKGTRSVDVDAKVDVNGILYLEGALYTTVSGANITSSNGTGMIWLKNAAGSATTTNQVTQSGTDTAFVDIPITAAQLKNADSTFTETVGATARSGFGWNSGEGKWASYATVSFDGNGIEIDTADVTVDYSKLYITVVLGRPNKTAQITLPDAPTKDGYEFVGWNTAKDGSGTSYDAGSTYTVTGNTTLYAQWEVETFTLTFLDEDGNELSDLADEVKYGTYYTLPEVPEKAGSTGSWHWEDNGYFNSGDEVYINENATFMASYATIYYDLNFDANGGYFGGDPEWTVINSPDAYEYGYTIEDVGEPTREGYEFTGWNTAADGSGTAPVFGETTVTGDTTYYAQWKVQSYTVTWTINGEQYGETDTVEYGAAITAPDYTAEAGYTFSGWDVPAVMPADDITLDATLTKDSYTVTWDANGGCFGGVETMTSVHNTVSYGDELQVSDPAWTGRTFLGWNTAADGSGDDFVDGTTATKTVTYYAQWESVSYKLTFTIDGEEYYSTTAAYGDTIEAPAYTVPEGYTFSGWDVPATMPAENITLDATLTANTYNVTIYNEYGQAGNITLSNTTATYGEDYVTAITSSVGTDIDVWDIILKSDYDNDGVWSGNSHFSYDEETNTLTINADFITGDIMVEVVPYVTVKTHLNGGAVSEDWQYTYEPVDDVITVEWVVGNEMYVFLDWDETTDTMMDGANTVFVREGHTVASYNTAADETGTKYETGTEYTFTEDTELYLIWKTNEHTVTWVIDGVTTTETVAYGTALSAPAAPAAKEGYTFAGWDGEIPATMPDTDVTITLTSKWEKKTYTVTWVNEANETVETETVEHGASATKNPAVPEKEGNFGEWDGVASNVQADVTIKPVYTVLSYSLSFADLYGNNIINEEIPYGTALADYIPDAPAFDGFTFAYWYDYDSGSTEKVEIPATMPAKDLSYIGWYDTNTYTVTFDVNGGVTEDETSVSCKYLHAVIEENVPVVTKEGHTFLYWEDEDGNKVTFPYVIPAKNVTLTAVWETNDYTLTFWVSIMTDDFEDGNLLWQRNTVEVPYGTNLADLIPETVSYTVDGTVYKGVWEFDMWTTDGTYLTETEIPETMPAKDLEFFQNHVFTGWAIYEEGTTYAIKNEITYYNTIAHIDGNAYLFDENGYIVANKGLVRFETEDEVVEYYYFCDGTVCNQDGCSQSYAAVKDGVHWVEFTNNYLPKNDYTFGEDGVIAHLEDTSINGIHEVEGVKYYFIDGVKAYVGLIEEDGEYYYVRSNGKLAVDCTYWISKTNGLLDEKAYQFDAEGKLVKESIPEKNGIYAEDGSLYYYVDGVRTYAGLIKIDGEYYYIKTNCEAVHGGIFWITKTNGLMKQGNYNFDENGKMIDMPEEEPGFTGIKDGYYYKDGKQFYAGLIEIDGYYYYVNSSCKVITGRTYWISKTNDLLPEKAYTFDAEGKMVIGEHPDVKNGLYTEGDKTYYYENGVKTYAGLIEIDGYWYYVKSDCSVVKDGIFWITKTNDIMKQGRYTFDAEGRMVTE